MCVCVFVKKGNRIDRCRNCGQIRAKRVDAGQAITRIFPLSPIGISVGIGEKEQEHESTLAGVRVCVSVVPVRWC